MALGKIRTTSLKLLNRELNQVPFVRTEYVDSVIQLMYVTVLKLIVKEIKHASMGR